MPEKNDIKMKNKYPRRHKKPADSIRLWTILHETELFIKRVRENELKRASITVTQRKLLNALYSLGGKANINDLASRHYSDYHNISTLVDRMEKKGLIIKEKATGENDVIKIVLTDKGKKLWDTTLNSDAIEEIVSVISNKECIQVISYLTRLRDSAVRTLITQETTRRTRLE